MKNIDILSAINSGIIDESIEDLSTIVNLAKSKKLELTIFKKSNLLKDFIKANFFKNNFLNPEAKEIFIYI